MSANPQNKARKQLEGKYFGLKRHNRSILPNFANAQAMQYSFSHVQGYGFM
jgi:hypothetical protein